MSDKKVSKKTTIKKSEDKARSKAVDQQVIELELQIEDLKNNHARALADYQNLEKRTLENELRFREYANEDIIKELLEVVDDLGSSLEHTKDDGIDKVYKKLLGILESYGVEEINNDGAFNPDLHEAIENTDGKKDEIVRVYRKGYLYKGKLLRASMVAVGGG